MFNNSKLGDSALKDMGLEDKAVAPISDIDGFINSHLFDINQKPDPQTFVLFHDGTPIASRGNLISISGPAKSRKSVVVSAIMASTFNDRSALGFSANLKDNDVLVHMDTEQAYFHYYNTVKRTIEMSGRSDTPNHFKSVRTRDAGSSEYRIRIMERLFELYKPSIFILDGITDLMDDINDNRESSSLSNTLLKLSDQYNAVICVVIHETKSTNKLRGAIGTTITNKVQCSISVELDEKNPIASHVSCKDSRDKRFEPFTIVQDGANGEVRLAEDTEVENMQKNGIAAKSKSKFLATQLPDDAHLKMVQSLGNYKKRYDSEKDCATSISNYSLSGYGQQLNLTKAKEVLRYMLSRGWVINNMENEILVGIDGEHLPF